MNADRMIELNEINCDGVEEWKCNVVDNIKDV